MSTDTATARQVGGDHYRTMKIQPVQFIQANGIGYIEGSVIKYVSRHRAKGGRQDLEKAIHFLQLLIEHEYPSGKESGTIPRAAAGKVEPCYFCQRPALVYLGSVDRAVCETCYVQLTGTPTPDGGRDKERPILQ